MSIGGNIAMGILRLVVKNEPVQITDPEKYLEESRAYNEKHAFHPLRDPFARCRYYRIAGCPVIRIRSRKTPLTEGKAILYLHGGIRNDWESEVMVARGYANHTGMEVWYPVYPPVTEAAASDIIDTVFSIYKRVEGEYGAENTALIGTSFGGTFGFGLINRINMENAAAGQAAGRISMPALYIANSPGGVPRTREDWAEMERLSKHDPLISVSAVRNIIPLQELIRRDIPEYANSPMYGDFTEVPRTYVWYAEETLAGSHLAYERGYARYGNAGRLHIHIQPGMMHGYSCLPVFKESRAAYRRQILLLKKMEQ